MFGRTELELVLGVIRLADPEGPEGGSGIGEERRAEPLRRGRVAGGVVGEVHERAAGLPERPPPLLRCRTGLEPGPGREGARAVVKEAEAVRVLHVRRPGRGVAVDDRVSPEALGEDGDPQGAPGRGAPFVPEPGRADGYGAPAVARGEGDRVPHEPVAGGAAAGRDARGVDPRSGREDRAMLGKAPRPPGEGVEMRGELRRHEIRAEAIDHHQYGAARRGSRKDLPGSPLHVRLSPLPLIDLLTCTRRPARGCGQSGAHGVCDPREGSGEASRERGREPFGGWRGWRGWHPPRNDRRSHEPRRGWSGRGPANAALRRAARRRVQGPGMTWSGTMPARSAHPRQSRPRTRPWSVTSTAPRPAARPPRMSV